MSNFTSMLSPQPTWLVNYLRLKRTSTPPHLKRLFYLSYEDALWDIIKYKKIKNGAKVLVPDFFCSDVEKNIKTHGLETVHYHIKNDLTVDINDFIFKLKSKKPSIIIVFHPVGITSNLFKDLGWLKFVETKTILIEDSVHRLVDPAKIKIYKENHFIINSLRKVVPLQGSSLYGKSEDISFSPPPFYQSFFYSLKVNFLWFLMNRSWSFGQFNLAEKLMFDSYDLIGDSKKSAPGFFLFKALEEFIDYDKIAKLKTEQAAYYEKNLEKFVKFPHYESEDIKQMRGWPIILDVTDAQRVIKYIREKGLLVRFELGDSTWCEKQKIIYLPMGPHITIRNREKICKIVKTAL